MSLTKEQWEDLAAFAGVGLLGEFGKDMRGDLYPIRLVGSFTDGWHPNSAWSDFGPLWMKLEKHLWNNRVDAYPAPECNRFFNAQQGDNEQELMQAGCLLGAAIGKTMREGK